MIGRCIATSMTWIVLTGAAAAIEPLAPTESHEAYLPTESISYGFGSKFMSGHFVQEASACNLVLIIAEATDPEVALPGSPTRIRLVLRPGQLLALDSEEGRSLNVTCGADATTLLVDTGDTDELIALHDAALRQAAAQSP
jgi:hypothetical protein